MVVLLDLPIFNAETQRRRDAEGFLSLSPLFRLDNDAFYCDLNRGLINTIALWPNIFENSRQDHAVVAVISSTEEIGLPDMWSPAADLGWVGGIEN